jgi:hypothetical protein
MLEPVIATDRPNDALQNYHYGRKVLFQPGANAMTDRLYRPCPTIDGKPCLPEDRARLNAILGTESWKAWVRAEYAERGEECRLFLTS